MERADQPHVIRRQILEIVVSGSESDGLALQRRLPGLCEDRLLPSLDSALTRLVPRDEHWLIDRLDIDAGALRPEALERGLVDAVIQGVEGYLREHAPSRSSATTHPAAGRFSERASPPPGTSGPIGRRSGAQRLQDALRHFLETGLLPWWFRLLPGMTLEAVIRESWHAGSVGGHPRDFAAAVTDAIASAAVRARLVRQFSPEFLATLLGGLAVECASAVRDALEELTDAGIGADGLETFSDQLWQTAFLMGASGERPTADALIVETLRRNAFAVEWRSSLPLRFAGLWPGGAAARALQERSSHGRGVPDIRKPTARVPAHGAPRDEAAPRIDLDEGVFVNCAGIVLLHPFLVRFFEGVGVALDGKLLQPDRALCLMHFLATGQRAAPEYDLLLPKLLCNVPPETPVDARIALTPAEEEEAAALLAAVVRHWDALGDTSADGLRGTFLVRPGRLSRRDGADVLHVEERSVDVLLDRLPWGISVMQLPWMERPLWVEWRF
jgi:hypothetical protein